MPLLPLIVNAATRAPEAEALAVAVFEGGTPASAAAELEAAYLGARGFEGKAGQVAALLADDGTTVLAVGVGRPEAVTPAVLRSAAAHAVRAAGQARSLVLDLACALPARAAEAAQSVTEGALLATYSFNAHRSSSSTKPLAEVTVIGGAAPVRRGERVAAAAALVRDLVNQPPGTATPSHLADIATGLAVDGRLRVEVWDEERIEAEGCGGLRGVSLGTDEPPRLIKLAYEPRKVTRRTPTVALVGKGITFDSGGLSLKTGEGMMTMKCDMAGAATVIAVLGACADLDVPVRVVGWVCATENLPGPKAIKPGDVLRFRNGKTAEVLNTDAEGRLVLADGLSLAAEEAPDAIIDLATLTGACMVALGKDIAGLMGNNDELVDRVEASADRAGELVWHLPLPARYRKHLDSSVADLKNIGNGPHGGALTAGLFLKEFVGDVPWCHLDIAGPAFVDAEDAETTKGGTGVMVRTLVDLLASYTPLSKP